MLSDAQITAGAARLNANKLTAKDVDSMVANFRLLTGALETVYDYRFQADLEALDDSDGNVRAAKMAAVLLLLIDSGFSVLNLAGKVNISKETQRKLIILFAFNMLYPTPVELTDLQVLMNSTGLAVSMSVPSQRVW